MRRKHRRTLARIFERPDRADIRWPDVEVMMKVLGATIEEGRGSRVRILLNDVGAVFHRPHPRPETGKETVKDLRKFLTEAGIGP